MIEQKLTPEKLKEIQDGLGTGLGEPDELLSHIAALEAKIAAPVVEFAEFNGGPPRMTEQKLTPERLEEMVNIFNHPLTPVLREQVEEFPLQYLNRVARQYAEMQGELLGHIAALEAENKELKVELENFNGGPPPVGCVTS